MIARLRILFGDRRRRQSGSILSSLLIIVAFLSILIGAVMTELTSSFLISRTLVTRMEHEATVTSAVELGIHQLQSDAQTGRVPPVCARDGRVLPAPTVNGNPTAVTQTCAGIIPDLVAGLATGAVGIDGIHDTKNGRDRYLVTDSSGHLYSYPFGQTSPSWSISVGGAPTASPFTFPDPGEPDLSLMVPVASHSGCTGPCVAVFDDAGGTPTFRCTLGTAGSVTASPAFEVSSGGPPNFPNYLFIADSIGNLYVYDSSSCNRVAVFGGFGGSAAGSPLVFQGTVSRNSTMTTVSDEVFLVVTSGSATSLQHWRYSETTYSSDPGDGNPPNLFRITTTSLTVGNSVGYAISPTPPSPSTLNVVVAGASGNLEMTRISIGPGSQSRPLIGPGRALQTALTRPPSWCNCPGPDLIGAGGASGTLFLLDSNLNILYSYAGSQEISTTPRADANGDWYFGADDGNVYDVEVPVSGGPTSSCSIATCLFQAAKFGPIGAIGSSPVVGSCSSGPCLYFGSSTSGAYFVSLGATRIIDLRACVSSAPGSTTCADNPRLWARVEVGSPPIVGAKGVYVQGWSYYSP
jgi:hypothetical protein